MMSSRQEGRLFALHSAHAVGCVVLPREADGHTEETGDVTLPELHLQRPACQRQP